MRVYVSILHHPLKIKVTPDMEIIWADVSSYESSITLLELSEICSIDQRGLSNKYFVTDLVKEKIGEIPSSW